jgi:hypothetical protein
VFIGRRVETAILLLLRVFVDVRMFTDIPLLLQKRPICHSINSVGSGGEGGGDDNSSSNSK